MRHGLTLGGLLKTLPRLPGGGNGTLFDGLVKDCVLNTELFQVLFDLRVDLGFIKVYALWQGDGFKP